MKKRVLLISAVFLFMAVLYICYCYYCYRKQRNYPPESYLYTKKEVQDFVDNYGPFSKSDLKLIYDAEQKADLENPNAEMTYVFVELSPGNILDPRITVKSVSYASWYGY